MTVQVGESGNVDTERINVDWDIKKTCNTEPTLFYYKL